MIHEYNCIGCGKREWHYVDDCPGEHPKHCAECAAILADDDERKDPNDCAECARSFGPHYSGPCEH